MSNREFKLKLWQTDPRCHWCKRETKLINVPEIKGAADPLMATIDHLVSRYFPQRWVRRDQTKVLACYECNFKRATEETKQLSKEELVKRGKGFSLNPRGKPIFVEACDSIDEVLDKMKSHGIIPFDERKTADYSRKDGVCNSAGSPSN
jgi:hypothetical protein